MLDKTNKYPHIIALGLSHKEIIHYYIEVEKEIIDVNLFVLSKKYLQYVHILTVYSFVPDSI